jgi:hypothetical protein
MSITIEELETAAAQIAALRERESELSNQKKLITDELAVAEGRFLDMLKSENMTSYKSKVGTVGISHRSSVKTPKSPEERKAFFDYLKQKGIFDSMISVNSMTLNAWYKRELDSAIEQGLADFEVPGLTGLTLTETITFRRN